MKKDTVLSVLLKQNNMKIIQNIYESNEYEYAKDYNDISEAEKDITEYMEEDKKENVCHGYTIVNDNGEDIKEVEKAIFENMAMLAMKDIGIPEDEATIMLEDYLLN